MLAAWLVGVLAGLIAEAALSFSFRFYVIGIASAGVLVSCVVVMPGDGRQRAEEQN